MIPPLSTTPSAPTMTRSTFSNTYLWKRKKNYVGKKRNPNKEVQVVKCGPFCCFIAICFNKCAYPTAASRTTVTGTFSFFKASAICRLKTCGRGKKKEGLIQRASCVPGGCEDTVYRQRWLTRLSQAATRSHKRRSVSSLPPPFPAPWGRLWSTSESGFSEGSTGEGKQKTGQVVVVRL